MTYFKYREGDILFTDPGEKRFEKTVSMIVGDIDGA